MSTSIIPRVTSYKAVRTMPSTANWNDYKGSSYDGIWYAGSVANHTNAPTDSWSFLMVFSPSAFTLQLYLTTGAIWTRTYTVSSGTWTKWYKRTGSA